MKQFFMNYGAVILGLLSGIATLILAFIEIDKTKPKFILKSVVFGIVFLISSGTVVYQHYDALDSKLQSEKDQKLSQQKQDSIKILQDSIKIKTDKIIILSQQLNSKTKNLLNRSEKLIIEQKKVINNIVGSKDPEVIFRATANGVYKIGLVNKSTYSIRNFRAKVIDFDEINKNCESKIFKDHVKIDASCVDKNTIDFTQETTINNGAELYLDYTFNENENNRHIMLNCISNGAINIYYCTIKIEKNKVISSIKWYKSDGEKIYFIKDLFKGLVVKNEEWNKYFFNMKQVYTASGKNIYNKDKN